VTARPVVQAALFLVVSAGLVTCDTILAPSEVGDLVYWAYNGTQGDIYVVSVRAPGPREPRLISDLAYDDHDPTWSPDGQRIAFSSTRDRGSEIYVMNADGSGVNRVTDTLGIQMCPAWSPDGQKIAFVSDGGVGGIWVVNADGTGQRRILRPSRIATCGRVAWSPDGSRIAFEVADGNYSEIYVVNADGSGEANLSQNPDQPDDTPSWLRDGRIMFRSQRDTVGGIYVMNADGSGLRLLVPNSAGWLCPALSPDERKTAFLILSGANTGDLHIADLDGTGRRQVTRDSMLERCAQWRP
jgi:TolB protein